MSAIRHLALLDEAAQLARRLDKRRAERPSDVRAARAAGEAWERFGRRVRRATRDLVREAA